MDVLTEEEIIRASKPYIPPQFAYIYYDTSGAIYSISPLKHDHLDFLEVPFERARPFLEGKKDSARYDLEYFKIGKEKPIVEKSVIRKHLIYEVPRTGDFSEVNILHNILKERWEFSLSKSAMESLERKNLNSIIRFYITQRAKPQHLYSTIEIRGAELITKKIIQFENSWEKDFNQLSLYTFPEFNSYGVTSNA